MYAQGIVRAAVAAVEVEEDGAGWCHERGDHPRSEPCCQAGGMLGAFGKRNREVLAGVRRRRM
jgi:hypothetical protein